MAGVDRSLQRRRHLLDAAGRVLQDLGRPAGDLRRRQEPDDGAHEPRAASRRLVAAPAVGNQPRGVQRRRRQGGEQWGRGGEKPLPHDGAQARRRAPLRRRLSPRAQEDQGRLPHQAAARRHDQRAGRVRLRIASVGVASRLARWGLLAAVLVLWQLAALHGLPDYALSPLEIAKHFFAALGTRELYQDAAASLLRALPGFAVGPAAGIARSFDEMVSPLVFLTYPVPKIVMLPVFMLWFGIGDLSKVLIIALACFYPAFINAYYGARATRRILVWSARNMGASEAEIFRRVVLPGALPQIFAGMRVALALSFIVMFAAEMINARSGLGHLIREAENSLRFDLMYVSLLTIAILGYAGDRLIRFLRTYFLPWEESHA